jgi:dephospho-CoA kinase
VILIGLTGGIGAGKSTVSAHLASLGAVIIDADAVTRELQQPGQPVLAAIAERFGPEVLTAEGALDRPKLAGLVFGDADALADLNQIVHPAVSAVIRERIDAQAATDHLVVLDVPLLTENRNYSTTATVVVDIDPELAVRRLVEQRGMTETDARARMARQASRDERLALADFVLHNGGTREELVAQVDDLWPTLLALPAAEWPPVPKPSS